MGLPLTLCARARIALLAPAPAAAPDAPAAPAFTLPSGLRPLGIGGKGVLQAAQRPAGLTLDGHAEMFALRVSSSGVAPCPSTFSSSI